jgi:hypothetical protein
LGIPEPHDPDKAPPAEIDAGRLKAIEVLLRKTLPDLSAVTHSGDAENPVGFQLIERVVIDPAKATD